MIIDATGPGRKGVLSDGVGKLSLRAEDAEDSRKLMPLVEVFEGGAFGAWANLMWAYNNGTLTA